MTLSAHLQGLRSEQGTLRGPKAPTFLLSLSKVRL